jgi:prevent-host-death family protein
VTHRVRFDIEPQWSKLVIGRKKHMLVSVSDAKRQLAKLVRQAEAGDEVVLTRRGKAVARLVQVTAMPTAIAIDRRAILNKVRASGPKSAMSGPDAARSQDFLYGEDGLPR